MSGQTAVAYKYCLLAVLLRILNMIHELITTRKHTTKRDIYYSNVGLFGNQRRTDAAVENIACMLRVPRNSLNVVREVDSFLMPPHTS